MAYVNFTPTANWLDDRFLSSHMVTSFPRGIVMDYPKLVEMIPAEKWGPLSDQLIGVILNSKNDEKMPNGLANAMLLQMKNGATNTKPGLAIILEAAVTVDAEKTVTTLGDLQLLKIAEQVVQGM
jgi:hypothetical protein